jgi:hypothetical protein
MAVLTITPPVGHGHRDPIVVGARRLLQDRRTVVTVAAITGERVRWHGDDGSHGDTTLSIFADITTPVDDGPRAA